MQLWQGHGLTRRGVMKTVNTKNISNKSGTHTNLNCLRTHGAFPTLMLKVCALNHRRYIPHSLNQHSDSDWEDQAQEAVQQVYQTNPVPNTQWAVLEIISPAFIHSTGLI